MELYQKDTVSSEKMEFITSVEFDSENETLSASEPSSTINCLDVIRAQSIHFQLPFNVMMCNVMISAIVDGHHIFVQQPMHPTFSLLCSLNLRMKELYNNFETPAMPQDINTGMICAAPCMEDGSWYRVKIATIYPPTLDEKTDYDVEICFVDYGGYSRVPVSSLRQITREFMSLPFQAIECILGHVMPVSDVEGWTAESSAKLDNLTKGNMLQVQAIGYIQHGRSRLPLVDLYCATRDKSVLINRQLTESGVAKWID